MAAEDRTLLFLRALARMPPDALRLDVFEKPACKVAPEHVRTGGPKGLHLGF